MASHTRGDLEQLQALPLDKKVILSKQRIRQWYEYWDGNVFISFSGGKDSTVLKHLVDSMYDDVPVVFVNTGLEFIDIQSFARKAGAEFVRPKMNFRDVITTYGYPIISKEVAEAIYYARRIRPYDVPAERERERENRRSQENGVSRKAHKLYPDRGGGTANKNQDDHARKHYLYGADNIWLGNRRAVLLGRMPGAGVNGLTGVGGVFSNPTERFGVKSQFNKEKWLPAARDLPFRISHYCCQVMKKRPLHEYEKLSDRKSYIGTLAEESRVRKQAWIRHGCNAFDGKTPTSQPLSFWTNQDILQYIQENNLEIAKPYGSIECVNSELRCTGCNRTGCVYCMFGAHHKDDRRFLELKELDPRQYEYAMGGGQWIDNPDYDPLAPEYDGEWKNWNPPRIWVPSKEGLGLKFVIDEFNKLYPKNKILY